MLPVRRHIVYFGIGPWDIKPITARYDAPEAPDAPEAFTTERVRYYRRLSTLELIQAMTGCPTNVPRAARQGPSEGDCAEGPCRCCGLLPVPIEDRK